MLGCCRMYQVCKKRLMCVKARGFKLHVTCLDLLKSKQCYKRYPQRFLRSFVLCYLCLFCSTFCGKFLKLSHHSNITFKLRKRFSAAVFRSFFNPSHETNANTYTCTFTCYAPKINTQFYISRDRLHDNNFLA